MLQETNIRRQSIALSQNSAVVVKYLLNVISRIQHKEYPTNAQFCDILRYLMNLSTNTNWFTLLSTKGQKLWLDVRNFMDSFITVMVTKNENELLQNMMYHFDQASREYPDLKQDLGTDAFMFLFCLLTSRDLRDTMKEFDGFLAAIEVDFKDREGGERQPGYVIETEIVPVESEGVHPERKGSVDTTGSFSVRELYEGSILTEFKARDQKLNAKSFLDLVKNIQSHPKITVYLSSLITYSEEQIMVARSRVLPKNRPYLDQGWVEFKHFVANLANGFDFDPMDEYLTFFSHVLQKDQEFAEIAAMWIEYVYKLSDPVYVSSEQAVYRGSNIIQQTQKHLYEHYCKETLGLIGEIHKLVDQLLNDQVSNQMVRIAESVFGDLFMPEYYSLTSGQGFSRVVAKDLLLVIVPTAISNLGIITIPTQHVTTSSWDFIFQTYPLQPSMLFPDEIKSKFMGNGMSLIFTLVPPTPTNKMSIIVKCNLDHLRLTFHDTNHKRLLNWSRKRMERQLAKVLGRSIEIYMATQLKQIVDTCQFIYQTFIGPMEVTEDLVGTNVEMLLKSMGFGADTVETPEYGVTEETEMLEQPIIVSSDPSSYPWASRSFNMNF